MKKANGKALNEIRLLLTKGIPIHPIVSGSLFLIKAVKISITAITFVLVTVAV